MAPYIGIGIGLFLLALIIFGSWKAPRLTSIIWWTLLATIFITSVLLLWLPGRFSEKALWISLAVPLVWVGLQFWCYWDPNKWRVEGGLIAISIIGGIVTFLTEPIV